MARNIEQVYTDNPSTTVANNDLVYLGLSPYAATDNSAIKWSDLVTSIIAEGAGGSTTQIQYNNAGALAGDTGFTTDGAGTETIVGQLNVDNLRLDGNTLSTTASDLQLTPFAGTELDINFSSSDIMGVQIRGAGATANPRLLFYRGNTTFLSGLYAGQNDTLTGSGDGIYLRNGVAGGKIFLRDSTGNALTVSAGNTTLSGSLTAGGNISATLSQNATTRVIVSNTNAGTSAIAGHTISNNSGASASINLYSSTYAAVPSFANRLLIGTDSGISNGILMRAPAGGFSVATDGSLSTANLLVNASGDTVLSGSLTTSQTAGIIGTTTNNNANAGSVGESFLATQARSAFTAITTATATDIASITLTAGDWDVWGAIGFVGAATTQATALQGSINSVSATLNGLNYYNAFQTFPSRVVTGDNSMAVPTRRISLAGTTTIYLVGQATFTVAGLFTYGFIQARRVR